MHQEPATPTKTSSFVQVPDSSPQSILSSSPVQGDPLFLRPPSIMSTSAFQPNATAIATKKATYIKDCSMLRKKYPFIPVKVIQQAYKEARLNLREAATALKKYRKEDFPEPKPEQPEEKIAANTAPITSGYSAAKTSGYFAQAPPKLAVPAPTRLALLTKPLISTAPKVPLVNLQASAIEEIYSSPELSPQRLPKPKKSINDKYNQFSLPEKLARLKAENGHEAPKKKRRLVRASAFEPAEEDTDEHAPITRERTRALVSDDESELSDVEEVEAPEKAGPAQEQGFRLSDDEEEPRAADSDSDSDPEAQFGSKVDSAATMFQTLSFLNTASKKDVMELASVPPHIADMLLASRPYQSLGQIENNNFSKDPKKGSRAKTWGLKIVEKSATTLRGYAAVESLIRECSAYNDKIKREIGKWGVTTHGADARDGELEIVEIDVDTVLDMPTPNFVDEASGAENGAENLERVNGRLLTIGDSDSDSDVEFVVRAPRAAMHANPKAYFKTKPKLLAPDLELKNYQQVGINWLNLLYQHKLSCILADEMGLGKTCQVIAFMAHLKEVDPHHCGKHLVVVPSSTLENWMREFRKFCPTLVVNAYYGSQSERFELREALADAEYDVLVTTYNLATGNKNDHGFLRSRGFNVVVYDEGHMLKNSSSERYVKLMKLRASFRLLLTGTPLQNNLKELVSLLAFILPDLFVDKKEDLQGIFDQKAKTTDEYAGDYNPLLSQQAISKARTMMTPFVLRRRKDQVLKHLPQKTRETVYCEMLPIQQGIYDKLVREAAEVRAERDARKGLTPSALAQLNKTSPLPSSTNIIMQLRKASLHPLLFRSLYTDDRVRQMARAIMNEPEYVEANQDYIFEDMCVMSDFELNRLCAKFPFTLAEFELAEKDYTESSGKVAKLREILPGIVQNGDRILIFSLFTAMLDILERVLQAMDYKFLRLDGSTAVDERQDLIDEFYEDKSIKVFLLSTKAGGFGINLVCANHVVIFDQSFNPHDDRQAEDRAHRVGQVSEV
ncbi:hypothetical protein BABINDRAFT_163150, partial [Babjeviella inositovora NRRL Y-12698]